MAPCMEIHMNDCEKHKFCDSDAFHFYKKADSMRNLRRASDGDDDLWAKMKAEAKQEAEKEPLLAGFLHSTVIHHDSLESALAFHLANKLSNHALSSALLYKILLGIMSEDDLIQEAIRADIRAVKEKDPAWVSHIHCMLNFKGFQACEGYRVAHKLWTSGRVALALTIQNRIAEVFAVDIHPGARIGKGMMFDHATGVVVGETAVIGDHVSILHNVTLGGTGKHGGDRHPKIGDGVLIGACSNILGNIRIGEGAKIGAGSVVLTPVPPFTTAVGNPARLVGGKRNPSKLKRLASSTMDHTSFISEWSDYVI